MFPVRLNIISCNIWNTERLALREPALRRFLTLFDPDILCLQELRPQSRDLIDEILPNHSRVHERFAGWNRESNIYWRDSMLTEIGHGAEDVQIMEAGHRRLFWARLQLKHVERSILVATAHLTHQRHPEESRTGLSPRVGETRRIIASLKSLNRKHEPLFFMGDLNDPVHPPTLLHDAGYVSCFAALGIQPDPTFKCYPTADVAPGKAVMSQTIDWLGANRESRPLSASIPHFFFKDAAPSDHWPVQAIYEIHT